MPSRTIQFRWRIVPVTLLAFFGVVFTAAMAFPLGFCVWLLLSHPPAGDWGIGPSIPMLLGDGIGIVGSSLLVVAAVLLQKGRLREAPFVLVPGILLNVSALLRGAGS